MGYPSHFYNMRELLHILNTIHPLSTALRDFLLAHLQHLKLTRKELLFGPEQPLHDLFFVRKGLMRAFTLQLKNEVCHKFVKEGGFFLPAAFHSPTLMVPEYVQAIEQTELIFFPVSELPQLYQQFPECNIIMRILLLTGYSQTEERGRLLRTKSAFRKYADLLKYYPDLILRVPAKYIASYLGISEETLSRVRSRRN